MCTYFTIFLFTGLIPVYWHICIILIIAPFIYISIFNVKYKNRTEQGVYLT